MTGQVEVVAVEVYVVLDLVETVVVVGMVELVVVVGLVVVWRHEKKMTLMIVSHLKILMISGGLFFPFSVSLIVFLGVAFSLS